MAEFDPIVEFEPLPEKMAQFIAQNGWPIIQGRIAQAFGAGIVKPGVKVVWTEDGRRITCTFINGGGFMIGQSKEPDPLYTAAWKNGHPAEKLKKESHG